MPRHHTKTLFLIFAAFWLLLTVWNAFTGIASKPWDSPAFAAYWLVKDLVGYLLIFWLLTGYGAYTGFKNLLDRALIELMRAWIVLAALDRIVTGNTITNSLWDWHDTAIILAALAYVLIAWWHFWRSPLKSDVVKPGRVYLAVRPPRNWLEFIGTLFERGPAGPVAYLVSMKAGDAGVFWYGPKNGDFRIRHKPHLPEGYIYLNTGISPDQFSKMWTSINRKKWTHKHNCFWMRREIERKRK